MTVLTIRSFAKCAAAVAAVACAAAGGVARAADANKPGGEDRQVKLIAVLKSDAPPGEKAIACKQLAIYGNREAVPALAPLLADENLSSWARIALEAIPDPAADAALREAMGKLQGRLLVGTINSIGVRRDAKAVDGLALKLKGEDADAASAAAAALGRIGGAAAARILEPALAGAPVPVRSAVAEGCILCAERFLADGTADEAVKLYDRVRKAELPKQRILEATRGAILARKSAGIPLLVETLKSEDKDLFGIGLTTARELPGGDVTEALVAEMARLAPDRQALLVLALSDRGDPKCLPAMLAAIQGGPRKAGLAAMGALDRIGNASCVPVLLKAATGTDVDVAAAAKATLVRLPGADTDADIVARLPQAAEKTRQVLIELVGKRRIESALPALVPCAEDADAATRAAAVAALGAIGGEKQVPDLVKILLKTANADERAGLEKALTSAASRGGAACTPMLAPLVQSGDGALRTIALHVLAGCGGPAALAAVKAALDDKDETVQDEAVRTLSNWPNRWPDDAGVAAPLLALAKSGKKPAHQILGLRGTLQYLQGDKKIKDDERLAKVNEVLPLAARPEEKRLVISVLGTIPSARALDQLVAFTADPAISEEACSAIVGLAEMKELNVPKELRQKALTAAAEQAKTGSTKKKAQTLLKAIR
jgi:HEAT repeat protein